MPIYEYICPRGHKTTFFKVKSTEKEPKFCEHLVTEKQERTGQLETFTCGLPLERVLSPAFFQMAPTQWKPPGKS